MAGTRSIEQQDKDVAKLWSRFIPLEKQVFGNGMRGLCERVDTLETNNAYAYEQAREKMALMIEKKQAECPVKDKMREHLEKHKEQEKQAAAGEALAKEIGEMRRSNQIMTRSVTINLWGTFLSSGLLLAAILGLILEIKGG